MLTVSDRTKRRLKETLLELTDDPEIGLKLSLPLSGRPMVELDRGAEGDQVVEYEGAKVLLVPSDLAPIVHGKTLDVEDTANGLKLVIS